MPRLLPGQILIPLIAAFLYALSTIFLKRALEEGTGVWRVAFASNMVMALGYQGCWVMHTQPFSASGAAHAALAACAFFAGQVFTFLAFNRGDVSVVTPLLGTKVIWVAGFSVLLAGRAHPPRIWIAVFLTALGTTILGYQPGVRRRRVALSIGAALATSCSFGLSDVLVQKYAPAWGFGSFIPTMFLMVGVMSLGFVPLLKGSGWAPAWLGTGSVMLAVQALGMAYRDRDLQPGDDDQYRVQYARPLEHRNDLGLWALVREHRAQPRDADDAAAAGRGRAAGDGDFDCAGVAGGGPKGGT